MDKWSIVVIVVVVSHLLTVSLSHLLIFSVAGCEFPALCPLLFAYCCRCWLSPVFPPSHLLTLPSSHLLRVLGSKFQVPSFRFQVPGSKFQVSGFRFQVPSSMLPALCSMLVLVLVNRKWINCKWF
jgi:hypothetical protein